MINTNLDCDVSAETLAKYFSVLVGKIFKILPLAEEDKQSAKKYLDGFHIELEGVNTLFDSINEDPMFISFLSIITWLTEHVTDEDCTLELIKREVFQAISICQKLEANALSEPHPGGDSDE